MEEKKTDEQERVIREEIPYTGIRKVIGKKMRQSLDTAPQGTIVTRVDMSRLIAFRQKYGEKGIKLSYNDLFIKLIALATEKVPVINATRDDKTITILETVNVGFAVDSKVGLIVPVVKDVGNKTLEEIAGETGAIMADAKEGKLNRIPMSGGTITLNNLGIFDIDGCTPFVNLPEAAILAVGAIKKDVWVDENDEISVRPVSTISLTIDHSILDGAPAGRFITLLKKMIQNIDDYLA